MPNHSAPVAPGERPGLSVLQVLPRLVVGGAERSAVDVAIAVARAGGRSYVASEGGPMVRELERAGVRHVAMPLADRNPISIRANVRRLADLVRAEEIAILHARSRTPAHSARIAAARCGAHFVTTCHGLYGEGWFKRWYGRAMAQGERVIANSAFMSGNLRRVYGLEAPRLVTIRRGIDVARFDPESVSASRMVALARDWQLPDGHRIVLMPARFTRRKGHETLLRALARLDRADVTAVLVGAVDDRGRYRAELMKLAAKLGLGARVRVQDVCRDMAAAYMLADVVAQPALAPESFGRVAVEAQAMGRPVVASDLGGARETILPGETGLLVPPGDEARLAKALGDALDLDAATRQDLSAAARAHVLANFTVESMCEATLALYAEVLARR